MRTTVSVQTEVTRTARVAQVEGMFDVPPAQRVDLRWDVDLPIEDREWNVGAIIGPSGCGKSTIARAMFPEPMTQHDELVAALRRSKGSLLDAFPREMGIKDVVNCLSSVGFSSPPAWVRPFGVLSNGEQFRVTMALAMSHAKLTRGIMAVDEFTSVVDRTVARIGASAIAKQIRRDGTKLVAVTCHEDIEQWLQPDWVYRPAEQTFAWRSVQPRPRVVLTIYRTHHSAWARFRHHHYLTHELNKAAVCFVAFADFEGMGRRLVSFDSWLPFFGKLKGKQQMRRSHRVVCLPDFQGIGIANAVQDMTASMWRGLGFRATLGTSHPGFIAARKRSPRWRMTNAPDMRAKGHHTIDSKRSTDRLMASFEYVGPAMESAQATRLLNNWTVL